jgi:hypothetical protein
VRNLRLVSKSPKRSLEFSTDGNFVIDEKNRIHNKPTLKRQRDLMAMDGWDQAVDR